MPISIDASELDGLIVDLSNTGPITNRRILGVMRNGANKIKSRLGKDMATHKHFKGVRVPNFSYDEEISDDGVEYEIGPTKGKFSPGNLANIAYFGTSRGGGTVTDPLVTAEAEVPVIVGWIEGIADKIL